MKAKKVFLMMVAGLAMVMFLAVSAHAEWYTCTVNSAGPMGKHIIVTLTDQGGAFSEESFKLKNKKKEILAVALSAMISGVTAEADVNIDKG